MVVHTLLRSSLRFFRQHPWQFWLSILSLALGTAVVVAVELANDSARRAFALSLDALTGRTTHQIIGGSRGFDEAIYRRLRVEWGVRNSAPVVEGLLNLGGETFTLLGVDPFAEPMFRGATARFSPALLRPLMTTPGGVLMSESGARRLALEVDEKAVAKINAQAREIVLLGFFEGEKPAGSDNLLLADIATAQELFGKTGKLDRIDLILTAARAEALAKRLPPHLRLHSSHLRRGALEQMTRAFHTNLTALSLLALFVGGFLIYNTMTFSVLQRRPQLAVQRMVGVTGRQVFFHVLLEALCLGVVGTSIGLLLGVVLGQVLLQLVTRTINDLYFVLSVNALHLHPLLFLKGLAVALSATLLAAVGPALEAARTPPVAVQRRSRLERRSRWMTPKLALAGGVLLVAGPLLSTYSGHSLTAGFVALFLMIGGYSLMIPLVLLFALEALGRIKIGRGFWWPLAVRGVRSGLSRSSLAVAALAVAISATVGVGIMIGSFRYSVDEWLALTLASDLYVSAHGSAPARADGTLDPSWPSFVRGIPGVASLSTGRSLKLDLNNAPVDVMVMAPGRHSAQGFRFLHGEPGRVWAAFERGEVVLISEPLASHRNLQVGDSIELVSDRNGPVSLPVGGVFRDYSSPQGLLVLPRVWYDQHWEDPGISAVGILLAPQAGQEMVLIRLRQWAAKTDHAVIIRSNREIRERSLEVFDRTFVITHVLRLLAIVVAFVGVFSALMALLLESQREYAILRSTGVTPGRMAAIILLKTGIIGLLAGLLSLPLGWLLSEMLIEVINQRAFGWSMARSMPAGVFLQAMILALGAALLAGVYPARRIAGLPIAKALREE